MEKNKNRTDLLAAGRKKLQQFRQKKDGKGNNSKSSSKAGKSGRDKTAGTVSEASVTQQHAADEEISKLDAEDTIALPELSSGVDSVAIDTAAGKSEHDTAVGMDTEEAVAQHHDEDGDRSKDYAEVSVALSESSSRPDPVASDTAASESVHHITAGTTSGAATTQKHFEDGERHKHDADDTISLSESSSRVDSVACDTVATTGEHSAKDGIEIATVDADGRNVDSGDAQTDASSSLALEDANNNVPTLIIREKSADYSISVPSDFSTGLDMEHGEEQVTDVGASKEDGNSSRYQIDKGMMSLLEGDGSPGDILVTDSGNTPGEEDTHVATQLSKTDDASLTGSVINDAGAQEGNIHSVVTGPLTEFRLVSTVSSVVSDLQGYGKSFDSNEEKAEKHDVSGANVDLHIEGPQSSSGHVDIERLSEFGVNDNTHSLACKQVDLSSVLDGSVIKLSQLADILHDLDEDEFRFLFKSTESSLEKLRDTNKMKAHDSVLPDSLERLKEHLYVTSFSNDALHLQLSEHQMWIDEVCAVNSSLQEVVLEKEELQKQLQLSKAEVEVFAAKVNELQNDIEMAQGEMSSLSSELVGCRNMVEALQAENEKLNESYIVLGDEKKQLSEENGFFLLENEKMAGELSQTNAALESLQTLLRDDRKLLEEENDALVRENRKLLADLAEYKSKAEVLEVENINLKDISTSVSEERNKLEKEKASAAHQFEKMSKELMDCKDLVVNLQTEISNLNGQLTSMTEERIKLEEDKDRIVSESEKQSHELMEMKVLESDLQTECCKAVDDLKEARARINQLTEENETLNADIEFHKCKVKELAQGKYSSQFDEAASQGIENDIFTLQKPKSESLHQEQQKLDVYDDSGFVALRRNLEDAATVMQQLEKEIEGMPVQSTSLSGSVAPGVSRLIQAFETKSQADDQDVEESISSEVHTNEDPYTRTKMVTQNLRLLLTKLVDDTDNASEFCRVIQSKLLVDATRIDRSKYDSLEEHTDQVEEANIELMVLYEAMKENFHHAVAKEGELLHFCDAKQKQESVLKSENSQLHKKMNDFQAQISELKSLLDGFYGDSDEVVALISNQLQTFQAEMANRGSILEEEWNSVSAQAVQAVGRLDSTVKNFYSKSLAGDNGKLDVSGCVAASVDCTSKVIEALHGQLEASQRDCQKMSDKTDVALHILRRLYVELSELLKASFGYHPDEAENVVVDDKLLELLHPDVFSSLLEQLKIHISQKLELESENKQLTSELMSRARETDELQQNCLKSDTILRLIEEINQSLSLEGTMTDADEPASLLESLIHLLVQKYREAEHGLSVCSSLELQLSDLRGQVEQLNIVLVQYENENLVFKQSLKTSEEDIIALNSKIQEKVAELEQAEQRVSSLREKLSIAVTKGKGLISQRDSLKQSLADTSKELEKCSQELLSKDARLHDLETKLEVYSEAGERMEALESELSYIRNSATALRESFLLKDSVLQRIEEILEDLELSEHFHSRDIIEKIDWLAKSVGGNSLPLGDWDQRSSVGGGSYSDAGFVGVDNLKEDMQPNPNSSDDIRRRFEELQNKFYGLAEQNEMLEQSLLERNNLVQRWEEILDKVDLPSQLRSMEPEDKIRWLESALSEAQNRCYSLQQKIDNLETSCGSLAAEVEDLQRKTSELQTAFQKACIDKEDLSKDLEILRHDNDEISKRTADFKVINENLQNDVNMLLEQKLQMEEDIRHTGDAIRRQQELVKEALGDSYTEDVVIGQEGIEYFEEMLRKLLEKYGTLFSGKPVTADSIGWHVTDKEANEGEDVVTLSKKLEESMSELMCLKEEKDGYMLNNQSLLLKVEELEGKKKELEDLLNQEEHKSVSLREKLNVAVRKGKSLVQQRDGMKQMIEELNAEIQRLKTKTKLNEKAISESEEQIKNLFAAHERVQVVESENSFLRDRLAETEHSLQEKESNWSSILEALSEIDAGLEINSGNPVENIKKIGKYLHDLRTGLDSLEQESRKSKRAAQLLLAELNEVQERNDSLQDELANAAHELSEVSREQELAENAKNETLAHVEKLSYIQAEERDRHLSEMTVLKSGVDNMRDDLSAIERELGDVLSKDLEVLYNMKAMVESFLEIGGAPVFNPPIPGSFSSTVTSTKSDNMVFVTQIGSLREQLQNHSRLLQEESSRLSEVVMNIHREFTSHKELCDTLKRNVKKLQSDEKDRESELHILQGNISLLYETCASAISKLENYKDHVSRNALASRAPERNLKSQTQIEGGNSLIHDSHIFSEESIRSMCDKLLLILGDFISMKNELMEVGQGEMKNTIMNLQKELQEKDIQRERICMELVNQIKGAETNAKNHLHDLQQARAQLHDSQKNLDVMKEEHQVLEQRMKELQDQETNSIDLQQKVNSLTDALAAKVQESESLMQALDEEEVEMENLSNKIVQLENELQQKNKDLENLEASRAKALKKLSVTVSKFDELHYLSENLLSEVEKLQSQLQEKDGEISFLRQEVTRCTNDALAVTHMSKKRSSDEIQDLLSWFDSSISRIPVHDLASDDSKSLLDNKYKEVLQKKILDLISELENLRVVAQNKDVLLQEERNKAEELTQKEQLLQNSLHVMESQLLMLQGAEDSAKATKSTSEIVEVDQMTNKWASPGTIAPQVRSLRKTNNDQVAIAIDVDDSKERLEDDDDDKAHGFKSLTTSKIVPRFTRPVSDMVDGLWVSCDRALMRQPALRLGVMIYWAMLHAMLAVFFV
ncbi:hypothetical protein ACS0TY_011996 [Phlomoides rotata]